MDKKEKEELLKKIEEYSKKIEKEPNNATNYYNRGNAYYSLKEYEKAINDYNKAIELNPSYALAYNNRGVSLDNLKKYNEAIHDYNKAIELDPNYSVSYFNKGLAYRELGKYEEAINNYSSAIKLNSNNSSYYTNRGVCYYYSREFKNAINDFKNAIKLNPDNNSVSKLRESILELEKNSQSDNNKIVDISKNIKNLDETNKEDNIEPKYISDFNEINAAFLNADFKTTKKEITSFFKKYLDETKLREKLDENSPIIKNLIYIKDFLDKKTKKFEKGYLIFADILGWKGIWQKQNTDNGKIENIKKLLSIKNKIDKKFNKYGGNYNLNLISDTFVIYARSSILSNQISKKLIELCLGEGLLIRGATSYGECYNKDMVYVGQAVDEAASWHETGEEVGIFYTNSAKLNINLNNDELEKYYLKNGNINIKTGKVKSGKIKTYFINWYNNMTEKKFYEIMKKEIIYPEISLKYFNTENRLNEILHPEEKEKE